MAALLLRNEMAVLLQCPKFFSVGYPLKKV